MLNHNYKYCKGGWSLTHVLLTTLSITSNIVRGGSIDREAWNTFWPLDPIDIQLHHSSELEITGKISSNGYPVENHTVETDDGYLLPLIRVGTPANDGRKPHRIPILLMHGLLGSSRDWFSSGVKIGLGYRLADEGYDVWSGNWRGNAFTSHKIWHKHQKKFWDFAIDEMSDYDLPAMVRYILLVTNHTKLFYAATSLGTSIGFAAFATNAHLNDKVAAFIAIAPVFRFKYTTSLFFKQIIPGLLPLLKIVDNFGSCEIGRTPKSVSRLIPRFCPHTNVGLCLIFSYVANGYNPYLMNTTLMPLYIAEGLKGTSSRMLHHAAQVLRRSFFARYNFGLNKNMVLYKEEEAPLFAIENVTVPSLLFFGANDPVADPLDVYLVSKKLKNLVALKLIGPPMMNHFDFLVSTNSKELFQDQLVQFLKILWQ